MIIVHGLGLTPLASLYHQMVAHGQDAFDFYLPFLSASSLVHYDASFRQPAGWLFHETAGVLAEIENHVAFARSFGYTDVILIGHSWGAFMVAQSAVSATRVLLSPLASLSDLLRVNRAEQRPDFQNGISINPEGAPIPILTERVWQQLADYKRTLRDGLRAIADRVLVVVGEKEHPSLRENAAKDCEHLTHVRFVSLPGAGHFYNHQEARLMAGIREFLGSQ